MILSVLHTPNGNLVELRVEDGIYTTFLYQPVEDSTCGLTMMEAKDFQRTIRNLRSLGVEGATVMDLR